MNILKHISHDSISWRPWIFICLNIIQYNKVECEGKRLRFLANGKEHIRPLISERRSILTLVCSMPGSNVNITNEKGQLLNSSVGVVSFVVNQTTCQDAGTFICQAPGAAERHVILFINGCHPVLCDYKQQDTMVTANLSTDVHVSICFLENKERPQYLVMQYNNRWIRKDSNDDKIKFDVMRNTTDSLYNTFNITIKNITANDYGEVDVALPVDEFKVLKFTIYISNDGDQQVKIKHTSNDNVAFDLICIANNYPKKVSLKKKTLGPTPSVSIDNPLLKPYLKLTYYANTFSCTDMGTYECDVTDFQGKTQTYEYVLIFVSCSAVLKLCDWQPKIITTRTLIGGRVNLTVCVFNTFVNHSVGNITQSPNKSFKYTIDRTGVYTTVGLTMSDVKGTAFRNYTINMGGSMNITVNIINITELRLCHNKSEQVIQMQPNQSAIFSLCVKTKDTSNNKILINNVSVSSSGTTKQYKVKVDSKSEDKIYYTIEILNFTTFSMTNYTVVISSHSGSTVSYKVFFNMTETRIWLCNGDNDNVTVTVRLHSPAIVHLCVSSNVGLGEFISIDRVPHKIYDLNRTANYCVSADVISEELPNNYYIQIYIRNVTEADTGTHEIIIKPTKHKNGTFRFSLQQNDKEFPVGCSTRVPKTYFFAKIGEMCNLNFCVMAKEPIKHKIFLNKAEHDFGDTNQQRSMFIQCSNETTEYKTVTKYTIKLQFNVQSENFTRYELKVLFGEDAWNHTFYLLNDDNLNNVSCNDGKTKRETKAYIYSNFSFCLRGFGVMDSNLLINNITYPIDSYCTNGKVKVVQYFIINTLIYHLVIYINDLTISDFITYNVSLPSMDKIYNFTLELEKFPLEIEFYGEQMGSPRDDKSLSRQATLGQKLILTCKVTRTVSYPVKLNVTFQSRSLIESNNETTVTFTIETFQCKDVGIYACVADMEFQHSKTEMPLYNSSCVPRWCDFENQSTRYTVPHGRDFVLPLCLVSYSDVNFTLILNGKVLSSENTSKIRYDKVGYDIYSMTYKANITFKNVYPKDYGEYKLTFIHYGGPNVSLTRSFHVQGDQTNVKNSDSNTLIVIIIIIIIISILIAAISIIIFFVKRKGRKNKHFSSMKANNQVNNEIEYQENVTGLYANVKNVKLNNDYENMKGQEEVIPLVDINDLNKKLDNRIYMNSQEILEIAPRYGHKTDKDNWNSLSDRDSNGLIYVTLAPRDGPVSLSSPRHNKPKDEVVYATLDYSKTGRLTFQEMEKMEKKSSKRKKDSQKKKEKVEAQVEKVSSLPEHTSPSRRIRLEDFSRSTSL
ncbi:unnamed protein product [Lymnaea stagnalis]|uniref:Ig-like domain-containing protein n=1 Tax=Lymnaea stagnalis TaxID=6523 RepID=A0AAV2IJY1_LYMST